MVLTWLAFAIGIILLVGTAVSVVGTLVVPRGIDSRISRCADYGVDLAFRLATLPVREFRRRDQILAWQAPVSLLVRLAVWIGLLLVGYALVLTPMVPGSIPHAFAEAGSSMFTLGYAAPTNNGSSALDYTAAYTGLVVVGLQVGYLPTLYAAFNRRETLVSLLVSRAGVPSWGPEILARTRWGIYESNTQSVLTELFDSWQKWAAEVAESHTTYLTLVRLRSPRPLSHWLIALLSVLDAAALHLALTPSSQPKDTARLSLRMGFTALNQIARTMRLPVDEDPDPDRDPISISYEEFAAAVAMLEEVNYPLERTAEQAWPHFRGWRVNYDMTALALARALDAPPALWSGPRRWRSTGMAPQRPAARQAKEGRNPRPSAP
ncbi:MAG TPA: hypothetical protein VHX38_07695 [Pseudonocardiaceae bacterium]|jgi:hypothetical protein|nr:hypothetical protein [Pseudonocardiaceae bacterium]